MEKPKKDAARRIEAEVMFFTRGIYRARECSDLDGSAISRAEAPATRARARSARRGRIGPVRWDGARRGPARGATSRGAWDPPWPARDRRTAGPARARSRAGPHEAPARDRDGTTPMGAGRRARAGGRNRGP